MMKAEKEIAGIFKKAKLLELNVDFASVCPKYEKKLLKKNTLCPYRVPSREAVNPLVLDETFKKNGSPFMSITSYNPTALLPEEKKELSESASLQTLSTEVTLPGK